VSARQVQSLQEEVASLRQTIDDGLKEPADPPSSELHAEIRQLRTKLANAEHASKSAWKARADDWKAFEAERATTKLAIAEAARVARKSQEANANITCPGAGWEHRTPALGSVAKDDPEIDGETTWDISSTANAAALEQKGSPEDAGITIILDQKDLPAQAGATIALEQKDSPAEVGLTNPAVTVQQLNTAIREILSPVPVVHGVLSPRDSDAVTPPQSLRAVSQTAEACMPDSATSTSSPQLILNDATPTLSHAKRRVRNWSRHKKGPWKSESIAGAPTPVSDRAKRGLEALENLKATTV